MFAAQAKNIAAIWTVAKAPQQGDFTSIQQAIDALPNDGKPYQILIKKGQYQERVHITRDDVYLVGEDRDHTIICASHYNQKVVQDGSIPGTYGSYTLNLDAKRCQLSQLTIRNDFDFIANQSLAFDDPQRIQHTQSVALLLGHGADQVECQHLNLISYHDTLYVSAGRSYFHHCIISGSIDFIFGAGEALFHQCDIIARARPDIQDSLSCGYLTAPSTDSQQALGLVFYLCRLLKEPGVAAKSYALGRPWHPTRQFDDGRYADPNAIGHCAFLHCQIDDHIYGWDKMGGKDKYGDVIWFEPQQDARFEEFQNYVLNQSDQACHFLPPLSEEQASQRLLQVQSSVQ